MTDRNWVRTSDRKPTVHDADEAGHVWVYDSVFACVSSVHICQADSPYYTHWAQKEKRPAPPAPKGEQQ